MATLERKKSRNEINEITNHDDDRGQGARHANEEERPRRLQIFEKKTQSKKLKKLRNELIPKYGQIFS